jgi:hypothetical protein
VGFRIDQGHAVVTVSCLDNIQFIRLGEMNVHGLSLNGGLNRFDYSGPGCKRGFILI